MGNFIFLHSDSFFYSEKGYLNVCVHDSFLDEVRADQDSAVIIQRLFDNLNNEAHRYYAGG